MRELTIKVLCELLSNKKLFYIKKEEYQLVGLDLITYCIQIQNQKTGRLSWEHIDKFEKILY